MLKKYSYVDNNKIYFVGFGASAIIGLNLPLQSFDKIFLDSIPQLKKNNRESLYFHYPKLKGLNDFFIDEYLNKVYQYNSKKCFSTQIKWINPSHPITYVLSVLKH